ncbi:uncharacterized protein HMPREF1541_05281 [Cyphellophora europaea CBS 101466]|uniref:Uncharacterized protein n=1 Tax=Cyphellophora europaea (strain CBS 101466) TaxID=1220924 RepID=W2RTM2_CYPE1|nr:uncharacterized protein HMPREF1541_05281 [Cyphellophora europaea CBS 101466]ETN39059.1 hypothetical protein HMPREF1541_05281 [Cyphellophora europaea CBS 101466]
MALKAWKMSNNYCPTCHQRLRRCDSPAQHATEPGVEHFSFRNDRKGGESSVANRDGSLEADRLIVPAGDEA